MSSGWEDSWLEQKRGPALAGSFSWLEHRTAHQRVVGSIPGQDTYLGCRVSPRWGVYGRQLIGVSLSHG